MDDKIKSKQRLTMAELARLAGVSPSTVSRALSNNPLVNHQTRERVQALAREHNYQINISARNFRLRRSSTIAVVAPADPHTGRFAADPFVTDLLASIADTAADRGYEVLLVKGGTHRDWHADFIAACRADGIATIGGAIPEDGLRELRERGAPLVVWGIWQPEDVCTISTNNRAGGAAVARHLLSLDRRRIAFLGDPKTPEFAMRLQGLRDALDGQQPGSGDRVTVIDIPASDEHLEARLAPALATLDADAVFAASDLLALAAIRGLEESGRSVPEDVAVVGYDNTRLAAYSSPSLTTVDQQIADGGRLMVDCLRQIIAGECADPHTLTPRVVVRGSCGARDKAAKAAPQAITA
ncbi:MAG: LacI family DNA-binding transcriptional regulator [Pseudomonadota bacterium]